jgi:ankyrin repeat protein
LWAAADSGDLMLIRAHIKIDDFNVFIRNFDKGGCTLLHAACRFAHFDIVKFLVEKVANVWGKDQAHAFVNSIDNTNHLVSPLIELSKSSNGLGKNKTLIAELLIERGASLSHTDINGQTALHWAITVSNLSLIRLFLKYTQKKSGFLNVKNAKGQTCLDLAKSIPKIIRQQQNMNQFHLIHFHSQYAADEIASLVEEAQKVSASHN